MGKIDRYILKSMALPTVFGVSLFTFIFLIDILVEMMEKIIVKNISPLMVFEMISYLSSTDSCEYNTDGFVFRCNDEL